MSKASKEFLNSGKCYSAEVYNYVLELEQHKAGLIDALEFISEQEDSQYIKDILNKFKGE